VVRSLAKATLLTLAEKAASACVDVIARQPTSAGQNTAKENLLTPASLLAALLNMPFHPSVVGWRKNGVNLPRNRWCYVDLIINSCRDNRTDPSFLCRR
jgi:hypothetical protein